MKLSDDSPFIINKSDLYWYKGVNKIVALSILDTWSYIYIPRFNLDNTKCELVQYLGIVESCYVRNDFIQLTELMEALFL